MSDRLFLSVAGLLFCVVVPGVAIAAEYSLNGQTFTVPEGFEVVQVAGPPFVDRPISAAFDEQGFLYVTDSSGSNEDVQVQLETRPHRIVRLEDSDGDGVFDKSVVFAEDLMFPEGALWHAGSLYVAAPPEIWKFTDLDGDGKSDRREVWFDGKTLTHCANDLHGPYLGLDGWLYWCKGAYAEQTYERPGRSPLVTSAAHIFRRHPDGGPVEIVMTGGMANPVDVVFTPGGERIFTTTFLTRPQSGLRDGLIHAVYGGVYGQDRAQLKNHPHTGPLMPVLDHLGAAAPCGLERLQSDRLGNGFQDNLMTCLFNMQKVTRHVLRRRGASFDSETSDFLISDSRDFHPTDVLEDADGSLVVLDTGGWYKLCCPTSQLWKPDILGAIYRVQRKRAKPLADPRGEQVDWPSLDSTSLGRLLADSRKVVRHRASQKLLANPDEAVPTLVEVLKSSLDSRQRTTAVWTLTQIETPAARQSVRVALGDSDPVVRQAALHSVSLHRDDQAIDHCLRMLSSDSLHNRRAAAEALGRMASGDQIPSLLQAVVDVEDRELEHSILYAAMEIGDVSALQRQLDAADPHVQRAALVTLDQMEESQLASDEVIARLNAKNHALRETAWWIVEQHPEWAAELTDLFRTRLRDGEVKGLAPRLTRFTTDPQIQKLLGQTLADGDLSSEVHETVLQAMGHSAIDQLPHAWQNALLRALEIGDADRVLLVLSVLKLQKKEPLDESFIVPLRSVVQDDRFSVETQMRAMTLLPPSQRKFSDKTVAFVSQQIGSSHPVPLRSLAVEVLEKAQLSRHQYSLLIEHVPKTGPMELRSVIEILVRSKDESVGLALVDALASCPAVSSLRPDELEQQFAALGTAVEQQGKSIIASIVRENAELLEKMDKVLAMTEEGDIRNGQAIFHSSKAACASCHKAGYLGGEIGPGLMRIGRIRTERDLLEAILFPSASFVQSFEPVTILTVDGQVHSGLVKNETSERIELQIDAQKVVTIPLADIEERSEGSVSIMPAGLDKQLTEKELADLVAFLKSAN